ncbi:MAG TPA: FAD-dependent oxidoreductase [Nitrolancea sp.]|nr:FAD-dependent oxidoreductase [Nitrolancea sp.]
MANFTYLIVGGGKAAAAAAKGIRQVDTNGSIGMLGLEENPPYNRPPLTKDLWKGGEEASIWIDLSGQNVDLLTGHAVIKIDPKAKTVTDNQGTEYGYDKLLLATGGTPRRLPFPTEQTIYYRGVPDYRRLRDLANSRQRFAVIGGGFIGSELAAALAMNNKDVTLIFPGAGIGDLQYPRGLSTFLNDYYREHGVTVLNGTSVVGIGESPERIVVNTQGKDGTPGKPVEVDGVVAGIGIQPNIELAKDAGLTLDNGVVVDQYLRTSDPNIFAVGDIASFHDQLLDKQRRVEHEDNANSMGDRAGRNMAGDLAPYENSPFFYSDLFDLGYEAVGDLDSRLETVEDWIDPNREGVVYYLRDGRVRGVLLWNVWDQVDAARQLIAEAGPFTAESLKGRLPAS